MKDNIQSGVKQMGLPKDVDVQVLFKQMGEMVNLMKDSLDYYQICPIIGIQYQPINLKKSYVFSDLKNNPNWFFNI